MLSWDPKNPGKCLIIPHTLMWDEALSRIFMDSSVKGTHS